METETGNARSLELSGRNRPATTPSRRSLTVSSFKHGHNGRRTKLTNGLLRAISDIIEDIEILSISHLNQELLARGHSLSRSTVFRAMEILGMRMDRDNKRWCISGSGVPLGVGVGHLNTSPGEGNEASRLQSAMHSGGSLDEKLPFEINDRETNIYKTGNFEQIPSQYSHILPNYSKSMGSTHHQKKPSPTNHTDLPTLAGSLQRDPLGKSTAPVELSSATKRFIDSNTRTVEQPFPKHPRESDRSTKTSGLHRVIKEASKTTVDDGQSPSTTGRHHTNQMCDNTLNRSVASLLPRTSETGRSMGRKRKSDCPAKITPISHTKGERVKKHWVYTPRGSSTECSSDFNRRQEQECFSNTPQEDTPNVLAMSSKVPWLTKRSSPKATTDGTSESTSKCGRQQDLHLFETQSGGVRTHYTQPVAGRARDDTMQMSEETKTGPPAKQTKPGKFSHKRNLGSRVVIQNHPIENQNNIPEEEAPCKNGTTSDSQILQEPKSANALQFSDQKPLEIPLFQSQRIHEIDDKSSFSGDSASTNNILNVGVSSRRNVTSLNSKCRKNHAPKVSQLRYGGHEMSFPRTKLSQIVMDANGTEKVRGNIDELQTENEDISKGGLQPTDTKRPITQDLNLQHRPEYPQLSCRVFTDDNEAPSGLSDPQGSSSLTRRSDALYGPDSQTARLHALTSSLAVKTSSKVTPQTLRSDASRWTRDLESVVPARINCQRSPLQLSTAVTPSQNSVPTPSEMVNAKQAGCERRNLNVNVSLDADDQSTQISPNMSEIRFWMQDISQKMASLQQQLNYLTQVVTSRVATEPSGNDHRDAMSPSTDHGTAGDLEEQQVDRFSEAGEEDDLEEGEEEEEEQAEMQRWGRNLPPIYTLESEDMISTLLSNARWESLSPFVGGPRLAIQLARDCIFGPEVLMRSTVTGRNGMSPLHRDGIKKIKDCMMEIYGTRCSHVEFELLWKMARESLSQLCKRIRRRHTEEVSGQEVNGREVNEGVAESYEIKPEMDYVRGQEVNSQEVNGRVAESYEIKPEMD